MGLLITGLFSMGLLFVWFIFSIFVGRAAESRGQSFVGYFLLSIFLSPLLALLLLVASTPTRDQAERVEMRKGDVKRCPHCAELVKTEATICKHCHQVIPANVPVSAPPRPVLPVTQQRAKSAEPWTATSRALAALVVVLAVTVVVLHLTH